MQTLILTTSFYEISLSLSDKTVSGIIIIIIIIIMIIIIIKTTESCKKVTFSKA